MVQHKDTADVVAEASSTVNTMVTATVSQLFHALHDSARATNAPWAGLEFGAQLGLTSMLVSAVGSLSALLDYHMIETGQLRTPETLAKLDALIQARRKKFLADLETAQQVLDVQQRYKEGE